MSSYLFSGVLYKQRKSQGKRQKKFEENLFDFIRFILIWVVFKVITPMKRFHLLIDDYEVEVEQFDVGSAQTLLRNRCKASGKASERRVLNIKDKRVLNIKILI